MAAFKWHDIKFEPAGNIIISMKRDMTGRKNKTGDENSLTRSPFRRGIRAGMHPLILLAQYRVLILEACDSLPDLEGPLYMWQLPNEKEKNTRLS